MVNALAGKSCDFLSLWSLMVYLGQYNGDANFIFVFKEKSTGSCLRFWRVLLDMWSFGKQL